MNVLKPHLQATVKTLLDKGISQREINRKTGVDRKTIRKYGRRDDLVTSQGAFASKSPTEQEVATGADVVATGCPFCFIMMDDGVKEIAAVKAKVADFVSKGQLGIFTNGYWGHKAMKLHPDVNLLAVAHYLQALEIQKKANQVVAISSPTRASTAST